MSITLPDINSNKKTSKPSFSFSSDINLNWRKAVSEKHKTRLYSDLHLLFSSGLDMNAVFEILIDQTQNDQIKLKFSSAHNSIISGKSLADSLYEEKLAGEYEYYSLKIGEESGKLSEVLSEIKKYYERRQKQRKQISGALTYPVLVLITAALAVGFMLNVIVPMFEEVFQRFQGSLPPLTQRIIDLSGWMKQFGWLVLAGIIVFVFILRKLAKVPWYKKITHRFVLEIPVFGSLVKSIQTARFCHIMALLTSAHSPLVMSLDMIAKMISFLPLNQAISCTSRMVTEGNTLSDSMEFSGFFDKKFTSLVKAAEQVNQLDYAFEKLNMQYNEEIDHKLSILEKLMEPLLIILVGGMVAIILISMYLPLFQIGSSIY